MSIPTAVSPGTLSPGMFLKVNLIAGTASPNVGQLRALILAPKATAGTLTPDTEIRAGGGPDSAAVAWGQGTLGHLAAKQLYGALKTAVVDFGAPTAGAGAATTNVTFSGAPAANNAVEGLIMGRVYQVAWLLGETASDVRNKWVTMVNSHSDDLLVTASNGATGVMALTSKVLGNPGNDVTIKFRLVNPATGTEAVTPTTLTPLAGGTTDADFTNILDAAQGREYHVIVTCLSNADAHVTATTSNAERALTHIATYNEGLDAKLQQLIYASTGSLSNATAAAVARNLGYAQHVLCINAGSLPCEFAGAEAGSRLAAIGIDPAANRIGVILSRTLYGSSDVTNDKPTPSQVESAIGSGLSIISYSPIEDLIDVRPVTTYSQNSVGGPDRRLLDTQNVDASYIIARDLRDTLPAEFPQAKIQKDTPAGGEPPPAGVIEERDVRAFVISRMLAWAKSGVILRSALDEAIADETLVVEVNDDDPSQVDILVPLKVIPPLAKFGVVVNREPV
jgi:phage tail sheath gpL-like